MDNIVPLNFRKRFVCQFKVSASVRDNRTGQVVGSKEMVITKVFNPKITLQELHQYVSTRGGTDCILIFETDNPTEVETNDEVPSTE